MNKIPVCDSCGKICGKEALLYTDEDFSGEYVSDCCGDWITYYDNINEIILKNLE